MSPKKGEGMNRGFSKRGLVIYLTGATDVSEDFDEEKAFAELGLDPDLTLLAASTGNFYDVQFATKILLERGAKRIEVAKASVGPSGRIKIYGDHLRLYG
jgi:hypothetical protein